MKYLNIFHFPNAVIYLNNIKDLGKYYNSIPEGVRYMEESFLDVSSFFISDSKIEVEPKKMYKSQLILSIDITAVVFIN